MDDPHANWHHNRCFRVQIAEGKATVEEGPGNGEEPDLYCPIQGFPSWFWGTLGLKRLWNWGKVILRDEKRLLELAELFPAKRPF